MDPGTDDDTRRSRSLKEWLGSGRPTTGELGRLLALARPHGLLLAVALFLTTGTTGVSLAIPWVLAQLVDGVLALQPVAGAVAGRFTPHLDQLLGLAHVTAPARLDRLALLLLALAVARSLLTAGQAYAIALAGERAVLALRGRLYAHLLRLGPGFYDRGRLGEHVSRVINDVAQVQAAVTADLAAFAATTLTLLGALALLFWQSWRMSLLLLVLVPPVVGLARLYGRSMRRLGEAYQDRLADASAVVEETLAGIRLVQSFTQERREEERFSAALGNIYRTAVRRALTLGLYSAAVASVTFGALVATLWFGSQEVLLGRLSTGDLVAFVAYSSMVATSVSVLVGLYARWASALGASRRVFALLERRPAIRDRPGALALGKVCGRLTLDGVYFSYDGGPPVLAGIDLELAPGETLAVVGRSGAGKSTLLHLVARFYDPTGGQLLLDGTDLRAVTLASLRARLAIVTQEPILFNASVAENLRYGRPCATDTQVRAAATAACAHEFVAALPCGYDTVVGDRGARLSTGERQRLAIARALLREPELLLLDEATSSLDNESERLVQEALGRLTEGRTTIVIAHRLSTVHDAQRIAVLDGGRVVELGPHAELVARAGLYARLYRHHLRLGPDLAL